MKKKKAKAKTKAKPKARSVSSTKKKTTKRKPNAAFMAPQQPSEALAAVVGRKAIPRTEVVKKLWAYIKKNNLQDPKNRRNVRADSTLSKVFNGKSVVSMFEMTKLVSKHLKAAT